MHKLITAIMLSGAIGVFPLMAQEKKNMPMKGEGMQGGGVMMGDMSAMMKQMSGRMHQGTMKTK